MPNIHIRNSHNPLTCPLAPRSGSSLFCDGGGVFFLGSTNLGLGDCVAGRMVLFSELPVSAGVGVGASDDGAIGYWASGNEH